MTDVKPLQIWDVRENDKAPWREAKVLMVSGDAVELQYLDMPNAPLASQIFHASRKRMLSDKKRYRLVREPEPKQAAFAGSGQRSPRGGAK